MVDNETQLVRGLQCLKSRGEANLVVQDIEVLSVIFQSVPATVLKTSFNRINFSIFEKDIGVLPYTLILGPLTIINWGRSFNKNLAHISVICMLWRENTCISLARLLCPWASPGKNIGVGCHALLQGIFPTQGLNLGLLHCNPGIETGSPTLQVNSLPSEPLGKP